MPRKVRDSEPGNPNSPQPPSGKAQAVFQIDRARIASRIPQAPQRPRNVGCEAVYGQRSLCGHEFAG